MDDQSQTVSYDYVAYVDEAGDLGLKRLRPKYPMGASEWFVLAGLVVSRENEMNVRVWVRDILEALRGEQIPGQRQALHFRKLNEEHQILACTALGLNCVKKCGGHRILPRGGLSIC